MKFLLNILVFLTISLSLHSQNWQKVGGVNDRVQKIKHDLSDPNRIIVSSNLFGIDLQSTELVPGYILYTKASGIQISTDGGVSFTENISIDSVFVFDLVQDTDNNQVWYASVAYENDRIIIKSSDNCNTWDFEYSNCEGTDIIHNLVYTNGKMFGGAVNTAKGIYSSDDNFVSCNQNADINVSIRSFSYSEKFNTLYFAADNRGKPGVYTSEDLGENWSKKFYGIDDLRIHTVHRSEWYDDMYLCGADYVEIDKSTTPKGLYRTTDHGQSWQATSIQDVYVYDIVAHPKEPLLLAAACGKDGVYISGNGGFTWHEKNEDLSDTIDIRKVFFPSLDKSKSGFRLLAGSYGDGMFKTENIDPDIQSIFFNNSPSQKLDIFPNPIHNKLNINFDSELTQDIEITITNLIGEKILSETKKVNKGNNVIQLNDLSIINSGTYFIYIKQKNNQIFVNKFSKK